VGGCLTAVLSCALAHREARQKTAQIENLNDIMRF
jgi:hypothetical protein